MTVLHEIMSERLRQDEKYGGPSHDDEHVHGELAIGAALYALDSVATPPWATSFVSQATSALRIISPCGHAEAPRRRHLIKAAALLVAEIERLDRLAARENQP